MLTVEQIKIRGQGNRINEEFRQQMYMTLSFIMKRKKLTKAEVKRKTGVTFHSNSCIKSMLTIANAINVQFRLSYKEIDNERDAVRKNCRPPI